MDCSIVEMYKSKHVGNAGDTEAISSPQIVDMHVRLICVAGDSFAAQASPRLTVHLFQVPHCPHHSWGYF